jgi:hypothetical protein
LEEFLATSIVDQQTGAGELFPYMLHIELYFDHLSFNLLGSEDALASMADNAKESQTRCSEDCCQDSPSNPASNTLDITPKTSISEALAALVEVNATSNVENVEIMSSHMTTETETDRISKIENEDVENLTSNFQPSVNKEAGEGCGKSMKSAPTSRLQVKKESPSYLSKRPESRVKSFRAVPSKTEEVCIPF